MADRLNTPLRQLARLLAEARADDDSALGPVLNLSASKIAEALGEMAVHGENATVRQWAIARWLRIQQQYDLRLYRKEHLKILWKQAEARNKEKTRAIIAERNQARKDKLAVVAEQKRLRRKLAKAGITGGRSAKVDSGGNQSPVGQPVYPGGAPGGTGAAVTNS